MASYAIGDIQGCYRQLRQLLLRVNYQQNNDDLWLVGDLVNRGPQSLAVLQFLMDCASPPKVTLGNHDLHLLAVYHGVRPVHSKDTFLDILDSSEVDVICHWLSQQKLFHQDDDLNAMMSHAGIYPLWNIRQARAYADEVQKQIKSKDCQLLQQMYGNTPKLWTDELQGMDRLRFIINGFTRMRYLDANAALNLDYKGPIAKAPQGLLPWFEFKPYQKAKHQLIFGHWASLEGRCSVSHYHALDTGCVWGKGLTAMRVEDGKKYTVEGWRP